METLILLLIVAYYLSGLLPNRRINKRVEHLHSWGMGDKILGFVDGDSGWFPWVSLPWPFSKPTFQASWKQFDLPKEERRKTNSIGNEIIYSEPEDIGKGRKVVTVTDITNVIRKSNQHVFVAEIEFPIAASTFRFVLPSILRINTPKDARKVVRLEGKIAPYTEGEIEDALGPHFVSQEKKWSRAYEKEKKAFLEKVAALPEEQQKLQAFESFGMRVFSKMEGFRIDNVDSVQIEFDKISNGSVTKEKKFLRQYLNEEKFQKVGFTLEEFSLKLSYDDSVAKLKKERNSQQENIESRNTAITKENAKVPERVTLVNDAIAENKAQEERWKIGEIMLNKIIEGETAINGAYKATVLVLGDTGESFKKMKDQLVGSIIAKQGGVS